MMVKKLSELFRIIVLEKNATEIFREIETPMECGHIGEAIFRLLLICGINPLNNESFVTPYRTEPIYRTIEPIETISARMNIIKGGLVNSGGANKIDACWKDEDKIYVCSSKIGMKEISSIEDLQITQMITEFAADENSNGLTEKGKKILQKSITTYALVKDKKQVKKVIQNARASNQVNKEALNNGDNLIDTKDLDKMIAVLRTRIKDCDSNEPEKILSHLMKDNHMPFLTTRFHQKLICLKVERMIANGKRNILIGALPRSGKTWIGGYISKKYNKVLVITTRPTETRSGWNDIFTDHRDFTDYIIEDIKSSDNCQNVKKKTNKKIVAIVSFQFLKNSETIEKDALKLNWDLVIIDEIHEGGSTGLSRDILNQYAGDNAIKLMMTATYKKPVEQYNIQTDSCCFWDLEDTRLMRNWGDKSVFERLCEKYTRNDVETALTQTKNQGCENEDIKFCYENLPQLKIFTTVMQQDVYNKLSILSKDTDNVYGFSMRSLFMTTEQGKFQNQSNVDTLLRLITGSNKEKDYKNGDMSMFSRIKRYWKTIGHRNNDEFMTQVWFIPYGVGQLLETVKEALKSRMMENKILKAFEIMTLDSGMDDIAKRVSNAVETAKENDKKGVILLTGNVGSLGISMPKVDIAFMMHDFESSDLNYQQMMRVLTEDLPDKKCGIVVDFNVLRVVNTMNVYASSRCGQTEKSSSDRISWCISNLIDVDPDLWQCQSHLKASKEDIVLQLTSVWHNMIEQTGRSINWLSNQTIDIGDDDQKRLDKIAKFLPTSNDRNDTTQERMNNGVQVIDDHGISEEPNHDQPPNTDPKVFKANLNDVLARIIPEVAILTGCKNDLLESIEVICKNPLYRKALNGFLSNIYQ